MKETIIFAFSVIFMLLSIIYQIMIGICYQQMIQATDGISSSRNKLLMQCKDRFIRYQMKNGGNTNVKTFVDKYVNQIRFLGLTLHFMKNLSIQLMLAGIFIAGFGVCKGLIQGLSILDLLPFYILCLFGIYLFLSIVSVVDIPTRKQMLKCNLIDYLENQIGQTVQNVTNFQTVSETDDINPINLNKNDHPSPRISSQKVSNSTLSKEDMAELQELLKSLLV